MTKTKTSFLLSSFFLAALLCCAKKPTPQAPDAQVATDAVIPATDTRPPTLDSSASDVQKAPLSDASSAKDTLPDTSVPRDASPAKDTSLQDASSNDASPLQAKTAGTPSTLSFRNLRDKPTTVYVAFGSDSKVLPASWKFCTKTSSLTCNFPLAKKSLQAAPLSGKYLNATVSFNSPVTCGITKAELNLNNPKWYDTADVSLVDGYSNQISIQLTPAGGSTTTTLGPPKGAANNEKVLGVFPLGCDICVARQNPPCNIPKGTAGCKTGTQYNPAVFCQYQGPTLKGGESIEVRLH